MLVTPESQLEQDELISLLKIATESSERKPDSGFSSFPEQTFRSNIESYADFPEAPASVHVLIEDPANDTVRIPVGRLDTLLLQAEEMIQTKISLDLRIKELTEIKSELETWKGDFSGLNSRSSLFPVDKWNELIENNKTGFIMLEKRLVRIIRSMERDQYAFNRQVNEHIDEMKLSLMLPVSTIVESFPLMVKDISRAQGKKIDLVINGSDLQVDKRILEEFKDALIHLVRNCIDHGISTPEERISMNKSSAGNITLTFKAVESGTFEIMVTDDGKGINTGQVLESAVSSGSITPEKAGTLGHDEIIRLIFVSGVTTSPILTNISGRGLGLPIVLEKVEKLNGKIMVESESGTGTTFHILLPMSLTTFRCLMVRSGKSFFMIPSANVLRVIKAGHEDIITIENRETIKSGNKIIQVADLGKVLGLPEDENQGKESAVHLAGAKVLMTIVTSGESGIAFKVDEVIDERQVLVKGLGKILRRLRNISGATVLGTGKIVLVLNVSDLIKSAVRSKEKTISGKAAADIPVADKKILVAEDSITARTLLKNILETSGYIVTTAIDGKDAMDKVRKETFDLIVSDIEMPGVNGFELTEKIKGDKALSEIPVVLVTALESREDRERGIEAGADAYIVKSSFDQDNLLDVIKRLV